MSFDPNATGNKNNGVFSLPHSEEESKVVLLPVPWEVTTSYGDGCSRGPDAIYQASKQLDLVDALYGEFYQKGIFQRETSQEILAASEKWKTEALKIRDLLENGQALQPSDQEIVNKINDESAKLNEWVFDHSKAILAQGKFCGVIGGDHSSPFGLIKALKERYNDLSILHIDAHLDLREAYQGYTHSHASIMYNVVQELKPISLVQLGIRDFCPQEATMAKNHPAIKTHYDSQVSLKLAQGETWASIVGEALSQLSENVYISFDVDGLMPELCPSTGTPVPGGLSFAQAETLLYMLSKSHKKIVGFDLCEVSPGNTPTGKDSWDANVGARILFKMIGALLSHN